MELVLDEDRVEETELEVADGGADEEDEELLDELELELEELVVDGGTEEEDDEDELYTLDVVETVEEVLL